MDWQEARHTDWTDALRSLRAQKRHPAPGDGILPTPPDAAYGGGWSRSMSSDAGSEDCGPALPSAADLSAEAGGEEEEEGDDDDDDDDDEEEEKATKGKIGPKAKAAAPKSRGQRTQPPPPTPRAAKLAAAAKRFSKPRKAK